MKQYISRYILTLVALFAMTAGAWAEEVTIGDGTGTTYYFPIDNYFNYSCTEEIYTADEIGTEGTINAISFYYHYGTPYVASNVKMFMKHVTRSVFESKEDCEPLSETDLVWTGSIAPTEEGWFTFTLDTPFEYNGTDNLLVAFFDGTSGYPGTSYTWRQTKSPNEAFMALRYYSDSATPDPYNLSNYSDNKALYSYRANIKLDIESFSVEISDDMTEAEFDMPANDLTVNYELVRDMSVQMQAQVGDGTQEQPRYRVKKDGSNWIPADMEMAAVPALFTVNDAIEQKALTQTQDYIVQIYAIDAEGQPTGDPMTFANFTFEPGIYAVKAVAADGSDYDGETALSNVFKLFEGYEVKIAPQSFATYYKEEPLKVDEETPTGELYTISSVTDNTVVLSEQIDAAPALTPLLVYNNSDEEKTILLLPQTTEPNVTLNVAPEFKGTLTAKTFTADDMAAADHYVLTVKNQFVWVKDAGMIAANRCWLEIVDGGSNSRSILFGDATGIDAVNSQQSTANSLYDLNGRKLQNIPTKKGIYIFNGRKVVVK